MFNTPKQYMYSKFDSDNNPIWICSCGFQTKDPFQVTGHVCKEKESELTFEFIHTEIVFSDGKTQVKRHSSRNWEIQLGDSWEPIYSDSDLDKYEKMYAKWFEKRHPIGEPCDTISLTFDKIMNQIRLSKDQLKQNEYLTLLRDLNSEICVWIDDLYSAND